MAHIQNIDRCEAGLRLGGLHTLSLALRGSSENDRSFQKGTIAGGTAHCGNPLLLVTIPAPTASLRANQWGDEPRRSRTARLAAAQLPTFEHMDDDEALTSANPPVLKGAAKIEQNQGAVTTTLSRPGHCLEAAARRTKDVVIEVYPTLPNAPGASRSSRDAGAHPPL